MPISEADALLSVRGLKAGYGKIEILHGVDLAVAPAEIVAVLGPNGAGKSTLMCAISGLLPWMAGDVQFHGRSLAGLSPREIADAGMAHVVQGHRVFSQLSVTDNLLLAAYGCPAHERKARVEEALEYFPEIAEKRRDRAGSLSGGQQQMMVVAQGLVKRPALLILDEPSAGLSPVLVNRVLQVAGRLRETGTSVLLVEQLVQKSLALADRVYALSQGRIVLEATTDEDNLPKRLERAYFGRDTEASEVL